MAGDLQTWTTKYMWLSKKSQQIFNPVDLIISKILNIITPLIYFQISKIIKNSKNVLNFYGKSLFIYFWIYYYYF